MKYNFAKKVSDAELEYGVGGGDWFSFQEGENRIRILSGSEALQDHFKWGVCYGKDKGCTGCVKEEEEKKTNPKSGLYGKRLKFLTWVLDRKDEKVKLAKMPYTIIKAIGALQTNQDYNFDEIPMPYDITITAKGAGIKTVDYSIIPSPKRIPLTDKETEQFEKQTSVEDIIQKMKEKKMREDGILPPKEKEDLSIPYPEEEMNSEEIPFSD